MLFKVSLIVAIKVHLHIVIDVENFSRPETEGLGVRGSEQNDRPFHVKAVHTVAAT